MTRVLVVDDYPAIADLIRMYIRKTNAADVDTCHSAAEALAPGPEFCVAPSLI